jgi:hypothetical protein
MLKRKNKPTPFANPSPMMRISRYRKPAKTNPLTGEDIPEIRPSDLELEVREIAETKPNSTGKSVIFLADARGSASLPFYRRYVDNARS